MLNITWTQNANMSGLHNYFGAVNWAENLVFDGFSDWRWPYASVAAGAGPTSAFAVNCSSATEFACRDNEMGYMFYYNLGGQLGDNKTSDQISGALTLEDIQPAYWSETQISNTDDAWIFRFGGGFQMSEHRPQGPFAGWAVRTGDVPEPPALLLSGLALGALAVLSRRTRRREARYTPT